MSESTHLTPYQAAKYVNEQLSLAGLSKQIPPQMMYNYTSARLSAGKEPFIAYTTEEGVNFESLLQWTEKYLKKQIITARVTAELEAN